MSSGSKRKAPPDDGGGDGRQEPPPGSLGDDLLSSLGNPALCDVTLVGSDGGRVRAVRYLLSARSKVLERLLVGSFQEATREDVATGYPTAVLKALVHFCCTDAPPDMTQLGTDPLEQVRFGVKLCEAAHYYELEKLRKKAEEVLVNWGLTLLESDTSPGHDYVICAGFDESADVPSLRGVYVSFGALIRQYCDRCLLSPGCDLHGVTFLRSNTLSQLIHDDGLAGNALTLFKAVKLWTESEVNPDKNADENLPPGNRKAIAKRFVSLIHLRLIPPSFLVGEVMNSGLVEADEIVAALSKQAQGGALYFSGAGTTEVNGLYEQTLYAPNMSPYIEAVYQKSGALEGEEVTFAVVCYSSVQRWYILAFREGSGRVNFDESSSFRKFYWACRVNRPGGLDGLVKTLKWDKFGHGKAPNPCIHIGPAMASVETVIPSRRKRPRETAIYNLPTSWR